MTDGEALLKAILAHPEEDTPRLVYADWLQENGQEERAEFIRLQIKIVALERDMPPLIKIDQKPRRCRKCKHFWAGVGYCGCPHGKVRQDTIQQRIRDRHAWQVELEQAHARNRDLLIGSPSSWGASGEFSDWLSSVFSDHDLKNVGWKFSRGFVESLTTALEDWRDHADAILAAHPIEKVTLTTNPQGWYGLEVDLSKQWPKIKFQRPHLRGRIAHHTTVDEFAGIAEQENL